MIVMDDSVLSFDRLNTPIGLLGVWCNEQALVKIDLMPSDLSIAKRSTPILKLAKAQLSAYFEDSTFKFSIPLEITGSQYQKLVCDAMMQIPTGQVATYGEVSDKIASSPRAVGNACRNNPIPIVVPCHRIVAKSGIGGYAGEVDGLNLGMKQWLLNHEGYQIQ